MELHRTIKGCDAKWTMTISVDPLDPEDTDAPASKPPEFPPASLHVLDQIFRDAVNLHDYARAADPDLP